ncbi:diguanylate cyclase [Halomonas sp. HK25]|uniref:diguanylate cyclase n=1 Tax=Halomonas sp. HK25 TaxID=3394321 RepID=UPI0039FD8DFD
MTTSDDLARLLQDCEREPVHAPGGIQPHGCLVSLSGDLRSVELVSANLSDYLGVGAEEALAMTPRTLLGAGALERIRHALEEAYHPRALVVRRPSRGRMRCFHVLPYRSEDRVVLEWEPIAIQEDPWLLAVVTEWQAMLPRLETADDLFRALTERLRKLSGHERVMVYRFDEAWNGSVIAENRSDDIAGLLHHHFPASDIPAQVRALYDHQPVRSFPDVAASPVLLLAPEERKGGSERLTPTGLDLSPGYLRAIAPVHQTYLANMGVAAALSLAMHVEGKLWGLVTCHSRMPMPLSPALRDTMRAIVQDSAIWLGQLHSREEAALLARIDDSRDLASGDEGQLPNPADVLARHGEQWLSLFSACGLAMLWDGGIARVGRLPDDAALGAMCQWLAQHHGTRGSWHSQALGETPLAAWYAEPLCGLLAVPIPIALPSSGWLLLFREELRSTRVWAGQPDKAVDLCAGRLTPRRSFAQWYEEVRGYSQAWRVHESRAASRLAEDLSILASGHAISTLNAQLQRLAYSDHLTGVWNRYRIEQAIDAELCAAERYTRPCSLLLFDIDHFKHFNDTHGHAAGDKVLVAVTRAVQVELREADNMGRWGGEEFIVLATSTDQDGARVLAERLRRRVAALSLGELGGVTISLGVTAAQPGDDRRRLVARADQAMYRAKAAGRNRIEVAQATRGHEMSQ